MHRDGWRTETVLILSIIPNFFHGYFCRFRSTLVGNRCFPINKLCFLTISCIMSRYFDFFNGIGNRLAVFIFIWKSTEGYFPVISCWKGYWLPFCFSILVQLEFNGFWAKTFYIVLVIPNFRSFQIDIMDIFLICNHFWWCFWTSRFAIDRHMVELLIRIVGHKDCMFCLIQLVVVWSFSLFKCVSSFC